MHCKIWADKMDKTKKEKEPESENENERKKKSKQIHRGEKPQVGSSR